MKLARGRVTPSSGANAEKLGANCRVCPLKGQKVVLPQVRRDAKMILLGESPGKVEEYEGRPFSGPTGQWVDECLADLGIARGKIHISNALLCRPKPKMTPGEWKEAISCCAPRLEKELKATRARFIFACGKAALQATTGIGKIAPWIGAPLRPEPPKVPKKSKKKILYRANYSQFQVLPTLHPTFCRYRKPAYQPVYARHLQRAWMLANGELKPWKWPKIVVEVGQEMIDGLVYILSSKLPIGVDVETAGDDPVQANLLCVGFANKHIAVSVPWPLDVYPQHGPRLRELIAQILDSPNEKVLQNGKHDEISLSVHNLPLRNFSFDTMLAHAVVAPELPHDLGFITALEYHAPRHKSEFHVESDAKGMAKFTKAEPFALRTYNAKDAFVQVIDGEALKPQVAETHRGKELLAEYMALARVSMKMQWRGIRVDPKKFARHRVQLRARKKAALYDLRRIAKAVGIADLNPNSNRLIKSLFFDKFKIKPRRFSEKTQQPKLDEEELQNLLTSENAAASMAARALLRYRRWTKLLSVYIERLPVKRHRGDLFVRSTWKVHGTVTGRWSSAKPNCQNLPRPKRIKQEGRIIELPGLRDIFCAREGMYLMEADYSQLELRILALLANDDKLLKWYAEGRDVHYLNAQELFETDEPTDQDRDLAKRYVYGANYGGAPETIWKSLVVDFPELELETVEMLHRRWFLTHPKIVRWQQAQLKSARVNRYVEEPISGRREYIWGDIEPTKIYNFPIQGAAASIINPACLALAKELDFKTESLLLQVHDALVLEGPDPVHLYKLLKKHMERTVLLNGAKITFPVDFKCGRGPGRRSAWGELKKVKSLEVLEAAWNKRKGRNG